MNDLGASRSQHAGREWRAAKRLLPSFFAGLVFAIGLGVSGMTDANKVIGFLNVMGAWDPSLAFVMAGAIGVHLTLYHLILRRRSPLFAEQFRLPTRREVDARLIGGAAVFGVGWALGGYCPGPALVSLPRHSTMAMVFVGSMLVGMLLHKFLPDFESNLASAEEPTC
jgi:uncharacterized protein